MIDHMLPREDVRDCLLFYNGLAENIQLEKCFPACFPEDAVIGTTSVRRAAFLLSQRADLKIEPFRGNVPTRIGKLRVGQVDATLLAVAGLKRLGLEGEADLILEPEEMVPAAGQGAVGIEIREGDIDILAVFGQISCYKTVFCVKAERAALRVLSGSCHSPIGAYARIEDGVLDLRASVLSCDGQQRFDDREQGAVASIEEAQAIGERIGRRLREVVPPEILEAP